MNGEIDTTSSRSVTDAFGPTEWGLLAATALIWGSSFLLIEIGLLAFRPGLVAAVRVLLGAAALALVPRARRPVDRSDLPRIALLGVVWMGLPMLLFPMAQRFISSSVAGMINGAVPLMAAGWSVIFLRRLPGRAQLVGLAVGFLGIAAISWPELQGSRATALGVALVVLAVILYGLAVNIAVPLQQRYGSLPVLLRAQLAALLLVLPFGLWSLPGSRWAWGSALAMVPLGVLGSGVAFVLMTTLVGRAGAARGAVAVYFVPVVAIVLGAGLLGDRITPGAAIGTGLVLLGAWVTSRSERVAAQRPVPVRAAA
ncbi:MAG TPA: DMT family transporter [Thermoanaerobaculia bacterium]|nr:DMT family transporter [Thermoanaerobaculia bacterium]